MNYGSHHRRHLVRFGCALLLLTALSSSAVTIRYHLVTDTNYGTLGVEQWNGSAWVNHVSPITWYGPAYGSGAGYQIDATVPNNTAFTVRVAGAGLPGGATASQSFNSGTTFSEKLFYPGPVTYSFSHKVVNNSTTRTKYRVDADGDGTWDSEFELAPGAEQPMTFTRDTAPTAAVVIQQQAYLGDGQWGFAQIDSIATSAWSTGTPTQGTTTATPPATSTDTTSKDAPKVSYNTATGGSVTESTYKTGVEAVRNVTIEQGNKTAEAVDRLRKTVSDWFTDPDDGASGSSRVDSAVAASGSSVTSIKSGFGVTNSLASAFGTIPNAVDPGGSFFEIPLGTAGKWGTIDWTPTNNSTMAAWWAWGKSLITWCLWVAFTAWAAREAFVAIRAAGMAPQAVSSSTVPAFSSGVAFAAGIAICTVIAVLVVAVIGGVTTVAASALFPSSTAWQSSSLTGTVIYLGELFVPLRLMFSLAVGGIMYHFAINSLAVGAMGAIRAIGV